MNQLGTVRLETDRLILRRASAEDVTAMWNNWAKDPEVTRFLTWEAHADISHTHRRIEELIDSYADARTYSWLIVLKDLGEPVGSIVSKIKDEEVGRVNMGYCLGRQWWHQGIMTEAVKAVLQFMISEVGATLVEAGHDLKNPNSGLVMKKCGMTLAGIVENYPIGNKGFADCAVYSITAEEWKLDE